ncbi:hypothetical protein D3C80_2035890 [compost metagenome]
MYNTVAGGFVARNVSSSAKINISPENAAVIVCVPAGGKISYEGSKMLVDGVVVDYNVQQKK